MNRKNTNNNKTEGKTAFFLGRFQPFLHNGHVSVVKSILNKYEKLIIGLGSAQFSRKPENFATVEERKKLWEEILDSFSIENDRYEILPIDDIGNNDLFVSHVAQSIPDFDVIVTGNVLVRRLFRDAGYQVKSIHKPYFGVSNTKIRRMIAENEDVSGLIPSASARFLKNNLNKFKQINGGNI